MAAQSNDNNMYTTTSPRQLQTVGVTLATSNVLHVLVIAQPATIVFRYTIIIVLS